MTESMLYPTDAERHGQLVESLEASIDTEARLPQWPFRAPVCNVDICEFDHAIGGTFGPVLEALAAAHGDEMVTWVMLDPSPGFHRSFYGRHPSFRIPVGDIAKTFWQAVAFEPNGDISGAVNNIADVVALVGDSGRWAVSAQRDWSLAMVSSQTTGGPWLDRGVPFLPAEEALAEFTEPDFLIPLSSGDRATFLRSVRERGSLP